MAERINDLSANSKNPLKFSVGGALAFWFWFSWQAKIAITYLFFQSSPKVGTAFSMFLPAVFLALLIVMFRPVALPKRALNLAFSARVVLLFLAWAGASLLWTRASSVASAFGYWAELTAEVAFVVLLFAFTSSDEVLKRSLKGLASGGLALGMVAIATGTTDELGRAGDETFFHPNVLAYRISLAAFAAWYLCYSDKTANARHSWVIGTVVLVLLLVSSLSKTSIFAFLCGSAVMLFWNQGTRIGRVITFTSAAVIVAASAGSVLAYLQEYAALGDGKLFFTLTGRTLIWAETWEMILAKPVIGYGFLSFRDFGPQIADIRLGSAHNDVLNLLFSSGVVGAFLAISAYFGLWYQIRRLKAAHGSVPEPVLFFAILTFSIVRGLAESPLVGTNFHLGLLLLFSGWMTHSRRETHLRPRAMFPR